MVSVASLLNPVPVEPRNNPASPSYCLPSSTSHPNYTGATSTYGSTYFSSRYVHLRKKQKMVKDGAVFAKGKIKGTVNYPPYEATADDPASLQQIDKFSIWPNNGCMQEYARHIPYNSEKKSFLDKTGRESFEVFQYIFKVPGDEKEYTVMWDYNIGLVRITPFFKCLKYSKTTPAKMLNLNAGLKEITHSITGGALAAQGYWMPYACALAICLTFCHSISGSLIPIFGPDFPRRCIPASSPLYGRMIIDPSIIVSSTHEALRFRQHYSAHTPTSFPTSTSPASGSASNSNVDSDVSPRSQPLQSPLSGPSSPHSNSTHYAQIKRQRLRLKRTFTGSSVYSNDTTYDSERSDPRYVSSTSPSTPTSYTSSQHIPWSPAYLPSSTRTAIHESDATSSPMPPSFAHSPAQISPTTNPWLSAIPRSVLPNAGHAVLERHKLVHDNNVDVWRSPSTKRRLPSDSSADADRDAEFDCEESDGANGKEAIGGDAASGAGNSSNTRIADELPLKRVAQLVCEDVGVDADSEKKAAWLLMKLSVGDASASIEADGLASGLGRGDDEASDRPRVKRRRAVSY